MKVIDNWLKGKRDFTVGVILYNRFGDNEKLKALLDNGYSDFLQKELMTELQKINESEAIKQPVINNPEFLEIPKSNDAILNAIRNEWVPLYAEMNLLRHELDKFGNSNNPEAIAWRKPRARRIKDLDKMCMAIWDKRKYYLEHGKLPFHNTNAEIEKPSDPVKLANLINNIKKNIRRNRQQMNIPGADPKYTQLYNTYKTKYSNLVGEEYDEKN